MAVALQPKNKYWHDNSLQCQLHGKKQAIQAIQILVGVITKDACNL